MKIQQIPHAIYTTAVTSLGKAFSFCFEKICAFGNWIGSSLAAIRERFSKKAPQPMANQVSQISGAVWREIGVAMDELDQMPEYDSLPDGEESVPDCIALMQQPRTASAVKAAYEFELGEDLDDVPAQDPLADVRHLLDEHARLRKEMEKLLLQLGRI